jgi:hypothetical protein
MSNPYGPWATLIDAGSNPQLSAFWRRRLTMLVPVSQTSPVLSRWNWMCLIVIGILMFGLPTFRVATAVADQPESAPKTSPTKEIKSKTDKQPPANTNARLWRPASVQWIKDDPYLILRPLADEAIRRELKLSDEQEQKLREIAINYSTQLENLSGQMTVSYSQPAPQGLEAKKLGEEFKRQAKKLAEQIEKVLTSAQLEALKTFVVQEMAVQLVYSPASDEKLGLSEEQKMEFARLAKEMNDKRWQAEQKIQEKMLAVLNPQQREKLMTEVAGISMGPVIFPYPDGQIQFTTDPELIGGDIRQQLGLSDGQKNKLQAITKKYSEMASKELPGYKQQVLAANAGNQKTPPTHDQQVNRDEQQRIQEMAKQMHKENAAVLSPEQLSKYKEVCLNNLLVTWLDVDRTLDKIDASQKQKEEIGRLSAERFNATRMEPSRSICEFGERAMNILTPQQRQQFTNDVLQGIAAFDGSMFRVGGGKMTGLYMTTTVTVTSDGKQRAKTAKPAASTEGTKGSEKTR